MEHYVSEKKKPIISWCLNSNIATHWPYFQITTPTLCLVCNLAYSQKKSFYDYWNAKGGSNFKTKLTE